MLQVVQHKTSIVYLYTNNEHTENQVLKDIVDPKKIVRYTLKMHIVSVY